MNTIHSLLQEARCRWLSRSYNLNGFERIYLVHIRKTGGTSLNFMLLSQADEDPSCLYEQLARAPDHRLVRHGKVFVGWNRQLINDGHYFYAFSHTPVHQLKLPANTFTLTCFRDPVQRVVSHYKMLRHYALRGIDHPCMVVEGKWLGASFTDFLDHIPREHLLAQLYMFSESFDVQQALERVHTISHAVFLDDFTLGIEGLNRKTGLDLQPVHIRKAQYEEEIPEEDLWQLREKLSPEYRFLEQVRGSLGAAQRKSASTPTPLKIGRIRRGPPSTAAGQPEFSRPLDCLRSGTNTPCLREADSTNRLL